MKTVIDFFTTRVCGAAHYRAILVSTVICLAAVAGLIGRFRTASARPDLKKAKGAAVPVLVSRVVEKDVAVQIHAIGNVQPYSKVTLRSQITGQLIKAHFQEGKEV